jgi:hypothetical protein
VVALVAGVLALALAGGLLGSGASSSAVARTGAGEPTPQTDAAVPARGVVMIGSSPGEASQETWGIGEVGSQSRLSWVIVRYTADAGWSLGPGLLDAAGQPLSGFEPDTTPLPGAMTATGAGALLGTVPVAPQSQSRRQVLLVRNPGGAFQEAAQVPSSLLKPEESLYSKGRTPLIAALDEGGARAGALLVPVNRTTSGVENTVLHWDGSQWASEPIEEIPAPGEGFRVLAIGATSPGNAWLLALLSSHSGAVALFRRHTGPLGASWKPVALTSGGAAGEPLKVPVLGEPKEQPFTVPGTGEPPTTKAQILTVTDEGVWIDGERLDTHTRLTMFFKPEGEEPEGNGHGRVSASWCNPPEGEGIPKCTYSLPDSLPTGASRSFAWADASNPQGFGQRVITGLPEGVSLRLEGASFVRVLALGGSEAPNDVGGTLGAAFSNPREGWLGNEFAPVHLSLEPAPNRFTPYPVPFRHALTAIAPQPGAPVGALSSGALAVGDQGEVARYVPGEGWQPESLLNAAGRPATPTLRAVAWPTPTRAYAVGELDKQGDPQMWLWRGETGLWEPDPAAPLNFRGNLLGIAFDPNNPSRGYAVGQQGVLLRYGKSWTQEALPAEVAGASFTSIAFAGSEAIVAYRQFARSSSGEGYSGGLLVNEGSGWHVDQGAAQALAGAVPWAVAGLPDGGAAVSAGGAGEVVSVLERNSVGSPWQPTAAPYPGFEAPSSLVLFREGGALRAIGSGDVPETRSIDSVPPPPAGFPPNLIHPYPIAAGYVIRQTAAGWSDEEHDRNYIQDPSGEYKLYDMVYQPDPTSAVLVDGTGTQGWAVGGFVDEGSNGALDTADVGRYPADGVAPPGFAAVPVQTSPTEATFAIGGEARCLAPCADRANAGIGPDVWLSSAHERAEQISGVRAFLYTGPRVTNGVGQGLFPPNYQREFARYAGLLGSSRLPAFAVASATDRPGGSECAFQQAFSGFPAPFGNAEAAPSLGEAEAGRSSEPCSAYYAIDSTGPAGLVRVIVLDDATEVDPTQLAWLAGQLNGAKAHAEPAIVLGSADLNAQIAAGGSAAGNVAQTLVADGASAYFYDAPEQNVAVPLRVGSSSIPTFGSGTLGYISHVSAAQQDFIGHSGFLLGQVDVAARDPATNRAPVSARLIPSIGELALEAKDGVLLRRRVSALFDALARRPRAGGYSQRGQNRDESATYIPIPANCLGSPCANGIFPEYTFSSSRPDIGDFVEPNLASPDPHAVLLDSGEKPIPDASSGLFCAYNAGTTVATISAGGLSASLTITVQAGSVRRPCGTQPLKELPSQQPVALPAPPLPAPAPTQAGPVAASVLPPVPLPPPPPVTPPAPVRPAPPSPPPFFVPTASSASVLPFVPLPVPTPARPTPPSGTSAVTSPVEAPEREEEEEEATESVGNKALAYRAPEHEPSPAYILGIVVLAAFAGASVRRRPRAGRRELQVAPATLTAMRTQRRMSGERRRLSGERRRLP